MRGRHECTCSSKQATPLMMSVASSGSTLLQCWQANRGSMPVGPAAPHPCPAPGRRAAKRSSRGHCPLCPFLPIAFPLATPFNWQFCYTRADIICKGDLASQPAAAGISSGLKLQQAWGPCCSESRHQEPRASWWRMRADLSGNGGGAAGTASCC